MGLTMKKAFILGDEESGNEIQFTPNGDGTVRLDLAVRHAGDDAADIRALGSFAVPAADVKQVGLEFGAVARKAKPESNGSAE